MTIKDLHHQEQMDAMRLEFQRVFQNEIKTAMKNDYNDKRTDGWIEHYCWMAFRAAKGMKL